jgi:septum formation protein
MSDKIILASQSPRRRELLGMLGFKNLQIIPPDIDEVLPENLPPGQAVSHMALQKAASIKNKVGDSCLILAADTIVVLDGKALGKPDDEDEAADMLRSLSGRTHLVYTGVALLQNGTELKDYEETKVSFRDITDREIDFYIASVEPMDKAGAYGAQGLGSLFISRIDGDFFNVVGLPLCRLGLMLNKMGIHIASYIAF